MRFEKITPPTRLLEKRQLRREMSAGLGRDEAFLLWAEDYFKVWDGDSSIMRPRDSDTDTGYVYLDTYFQRKAAFENFIEHSGISGNKKQQYSAQRFKKHLKTWARYKGFELNPDDVCTDIPNNRIMRNEGKLVEYFYIRSSQSISSQEDNEDTELDNQLAF